MDASDNIYKGFWTNWSEGHVNGVTLTVSRRDGAYLIAFLALFVHVVGASFWRLASFVIFHAKAVPHLEDNVGLQQQTILRNSASAISGLRGFMKIFLRSRKPRKNLPMVVWSGLNFALFLVAGIMSSKVTSTTSDVLLTPSHCGRWWTPIHLHAANATALFEAGVAQSALSNLQAASCKKASTCYGNNSISNSCLNPGRRNLSWKTSVSSNCPFSDLCADKTLSVDSGFLDSDLDLGINAPTKHRVSLRLRLQCAPIKQSEYMENYSGSNISSLFALTPSELAAYVFKEPIEDLAYETFFYGPTTSYAYTPQSQATFIFNKGTIAYSMSPEWQKAIVNLNFAKAEFDSTGQLIDSDLSRFHPIPQLVVPGQQISLVFLSIAPWYSLRAVKDPWFKIDRSFTTPFKLQGDPETVNITMYFRRPDTTVLGCASHSEICSGTSESDTLCSNLLSDGTLSGPKSLAQILGPNERQVQIAERLRDAYRWSSFVNVLTSSGGPGLLASQYLATQNYEAPLPDNQWMLEVENWFAGVLVMLETFTKSYVTGMPDVKPDLYSAPAKDEEWMCQNQVIQSTDYASFNVLGLCIILFVGGVIIAINIFDKRLCRFMLRKTETNEHRQASWEKNDLLSLQAAALQRRNSNESSRGASLDEPEGLKTVEFDEKR